MNDQFRHLEVQLLAILESRYNLAAFMLVSLYLVEEMRFIVKLLKSVAGR